MPASTAQRTILHIVNPAAGQGEACSKLPKEDALTVYSTRGPYDAQRFVAESATQNPYTHFYVYGGDGTLSEVINGIMEAGANHTAQISIIAAGTGNDFVRSIPKEHGSCKVDLIRYGNRYAINVLNTGFDCQVAARISSLKNKPFVAGSFAYTIGVLQTLSHRLGRNLQITLTDESDTIHTFSQNNLLCAIGNGKYYGGGYCALPTANFSDGLLDVVMVEKISRRRFLSLVRHYKAGTHIDIQNHSVTGRFCDIMHFYRCKKIHIEGTDLICADGEIFSAKSVDIEVVPQAIQLVW